MWVVLLPELYAQYLKKHFNYPQYLLLVILINLLPNVRTVKLEQLVWVFPYSILLRSRIRKIQRFLSLPQLKVKTAWFPIVLNWIEQQGNPGEVIHEYERFHNAIESKFGQGKRRYGLNRVMSNYKIYHYLQIFS